MPGALIGVALVGPRHVGWCPMTAQQDQPRAGHELLSIGSLPTQLRIPIAFNHLGREAFASAESRSLLHVLDSELLHRFGLVISMVEQVYLARGLAQVHLAPFRDSAILLQAAVISTDAQLFIVANPPLCAVLFAVRHHAHGQFDTVREELCDARFGCKTYSSRKGG